MSSSRTNLTTAFPSPLRRGDGVFVALLLAAVTYVAVVFAGGTMIRTGHPLASEVGRVVQQVSMIQPAIEWTESQQWTPLASALRLIADGAPIATLKF